MSVLEASGLSKRYRGVCALSDCNLAIPAGRVVALVGPNGAGKSTLLNLAAGLRRPSAGRIRVLDGQVPGSRAALAGTGSSLRPRRCTGTCRLLACCTWLAP